MTSYAAPERLLALGTAYTRHHDALAGLLHSGNRSACTLARHIPRTQALARDALEVPSLLRGLSLYHSPEVLSGLDRIMQLAALATTATDHLLDAVDFRACKTRARAGQLTIRTDVAAYPVWIFSGRVPGVIASPPCQAWSMAGKRLGLVDQPLVHQAVADRAAGRDTREQLLGACADGRSP